MDGASATRTYDDEITVARAPAEIPMAVERLTNAVDRYRGLLSQLEDALGPVLRATDVGGERPEDRERPCRTALGQAVWDQGERLGESNVALQDLLDRVRLAL